ncbi:hypothetical protein OSTOST_24832, partial [Ostertagia ostertagi]
SSDEKETIDEFDEYWKSKNGEEVLEEAEKQLRLLEKRLVELRCQSASVQQEMSQQPHHVGQITLPQVVANPLSESPPHVTSEIPIVNPNSASLETRNTLDNLWRALDRRLLGNELKIPEFSGKASDFDSFWELFEELVDKQPYSNIEKFPILINCCTGDAARTIQMIPRTGDSYGKAVEQLKKQYKDHKEDDPRSLRNTLNDVQAGIAPYRTSGENKG